jgi:hypothetical protein
MAWEKGQSGNLRGRPLNERCFAALLRIAAAEADAATGKQNLRIVADKLMESAKPGESWAIQQLADRLDGKPQQTSSVSLAPRSVTEMTTAELLAIAAQGRVKTDDDEPE